MRHWGLPEAWTQKGGSTTSDKLHVESLTPQLQPQRIGVSWIRRLPWVKVAGVIFLGIAAVVAFDPDYPVSRPGVTQLKDQKRITPQSPRGPTLVGAEFRWHAAFESPEWRIVLLSGDRQELCWSPPQRGMAYSPEGEFRAALEKRGRYYWYVVGAKDGSPVRSDVTAILVR